MTATSVIEALRPRFGDRLATSHAIRDQHSRDMSRLPPSLPDAVVWPETEAEVQDILRQCHAAGVPVIPYGAGSSMEGHTIPVRNGITVNTSRMNRIREIAAEDLLAVVEPGVTRLQLNTDLRATGLTFPIDPGADASLGGMASTRGSGTMAVRYGTMRENVLALRVVLPDGRVIRTGTRARKSSTGYDLTHLIVGSEGTLGIITELTVRLHPVPEAVSAYADRLGPLALLVNNAGIADPLARRWTFHNHPSRWQTIYKTFTGFGSRLNSLAAFRPRMLRLASSVRNGRS